jgi:hypothetical protein
MSSVSAPSAIDGIRMYPGSLDDALPSPGVNPLEGSPKCSCGKRDSEGAPGFQL